MIELLDSMNNIWHVQHVSLTLFVYAYEQNKVISSILSTLWWWWLWWLPVTEWRYTQSICE